MKIEWQRRCQGKGAFDNTLFEEGVGGFCSLSQFLHRSFRFHFTHTMIMNSLL